MALLALGDLYTPIKVVLRCMNKPGPLCSLCPLKDADGPVWGNGPANARLVVIGICPGPDEITQGRPFVGSSGSVFNNASRRVGIQRDRIFVTNVVKCFIQPGKPVPQQAVDCCRPLLDQELGQLEYAKVYLTLGGVPFEEFTGRKFKTTTNKKDTKAWLRGAPWHFGSKTIIPLAHPRYIASTQFREMPIFEADLRKGKRWAEGGGVRPKEVLLYSPTSSDVQEYVEECTGKGRYGVDIETPWAAVDDQELAAGGKTDIQVIGLSANVGEAMGVPPDLFGLLNPLFGPRENPVRAYAFNAGFDFFHLAKWFDLTGTQPYCVMLALNLLYSDLRPKDLGMCLSLFTDMGFHKNMISTHPDLYNARDTYGALWAGMETEPALKEMGLWEVFWKQDMPLIKIVESFRTIGANCDVPHAQKLELTCYAGLEKYEEFWNKNFPLVSWSSPKQLIDLFTVQKLPMRFKLRTSSYTKQKKRTPCVDEDVLEEYRDKYKSQTAGLILLMRKLKKASDFTRYYDSEGRARPQFKIHGQVAGRLQAKDPQLQQIPEELAGIHPREIIIPDNPENEVILVADFEQIELWVYAYVSKCKNLLVQKASGDYIHGLFYEQFFEKPFFQEGRPKKKAYKRKDVPPQELLAAKSGPLGFIYGRGKDSLTELHGISPMKASLIYNTFHNQNPEIHLYHRELIHEVKQSGYARNCFGRIRRFPNTRAMYAEILSYSGQSNAADILRQNALIPLYNHLPDYGARMLFTVHDSVIINAKKAGLVDTVSFIRDTMETPIPQMENFFIPTEITAGPNWHDQTLWEEYGETG